MRSPVAGVASLLLLFIVLILGYSSVFTVAQTEQVLLVRLGEPIRVVTERSQLAMPETRIGFTPDVGGTWLLARAPGRLGEYLGLTGAVMDGSDAIYAGFADHFVPSANLDGLRDALETRADPSSPTELVLLFDETPERSKLGVHNRDAARTPMAWTGAPGAGDRKSVV